MSRILVTGAAGYIGSHLCVELIEQGHDVVGVDNLSNSSTDVLDIIAELAGPIVFVEADVRDRPALQAVFAAQRIDTVLHLAGVKSVAESMTAPLRYHDTNLGGSLSLLEAMSSAGVKRLVFSSSCTVYGEGGTGGEAINEGAGVAPTNPYGRSKAAVETVLRDLAAADPAWRVLSLRYFNPAGTHPSHRLGDDPTMSPGNLVPLVIEAAAGVRTHVDVQGTDYPTPDGTCIRDYVHITDLVRAHVAAIDALVDGCGFDAVNLGTQRGSSVLDVINTVERISGVTIHRRTADRRPGDAAALFADASKARAVLDWKTTHDLEDMCRDHWIWLQNGLADGP